MTENALIKKLQLKPGLRALFLNAPEGYVASLGPLPDGVALVDGPPGTLDFVQLFVRDSVELTRHAPVALAAIKRDGVLWISYPKQERQESSADLPAMRLGAAHRRRPAPGDPNRDRRDLVGAALAADRPGFNCGRATSNPQSRSPTGADFRWNPG